MSNFDILCDSPDYHDGAGFFCGGGVIFYRYLPTSHSLPHLLCRSVKMLSIKMLVMFF